MTPIRYWRCVLWTEDGPPDYDASGSEVFIDERIAPNEDWADRIMWWLVFESNYYDWGSVHGMEPEPLPKGVYPRQVVGP